MKGWLIILTSMTVVCARAQQGQETRTGEIAVSGSARVWADITFSPLLHIELGSGAENKNADVVGLALNTAEDYANGVEKRVNGQLKVFAMGTNYTVIAGFGKNALANVLRLNVGGKGSQLKPYGIRPGIHVHGGSPKGEEELDALYALPAMTADNLEAFNALIGKDGTPKTHWIDLTYTILSR